MYSTLAFAVMVLISSSITVIAGFIPSTKHFQEEHDCFIGGTDLIGKVDWSLYQQQLDETQYNFRIHHELLSDIDNLVVLELIVDKIVSFNHSNTFVSNDKNRALFYKFIETNVTVEVFNNDPSTRNINCCFSMIMYWQPIWAGTQTNVNNWCIRECEHDAWTCRSCGALWPESRSRITSSTGCGRQFGYGTTGSPFCIAHSKCSVSAGNHVWK